MANVRFYKLEVLPNFDVSKQGIFVHVTKTMKNEIWDLSNGNKVDPATLWMTLGKDGGSVERMNLVQWLEKRRITSIASGLWFGGENGWELLSNETNSAAINAAINNKIATLDVDGYAQAGMSDNGTDSTLTIKGIQEVDGKIGIPAESENLDLDIAIDGVYNESSNKIATESTVTTAITGLNAETVQAVTKTTSDNITTLTLKGVKEENGVIAQGNGTDFFIVSDAKLNIQIGSADAFEVFAANKQSDSTIKLDGYVFQKGENDVISVITPTPVALDNKLVTQKDIANLSGAMHYKGSILNADAWPLTVKAGDVYIATGNFVKDGNTIESGDLIVFNSATLTDYKVVQSNITLGIGDGQVAANVGALTNGNLVVGVNDPETGKKGIKTVEFDVTNLTGETGKNERTLTLKSQLADNELQSDGSGMPSLYHSVGITDTFTIMGRDMSKSFTISSPNRSISIERVGDENSTDAQIDLIWNTVMDA